MTNEEYKKYADRHAPRSPLLKDMLFAFLIGGFICCLGQLAGDLYRNLCGLDKEAAASATSITLVFLGALLTGLGVYDDIARRSRYARADNGLCKLRRRSGARIQDRSSLYNWDSQRKPQSVSIRTESDKICWKGGT